MRKFLSGTQMFGGFFSGWALILLAGAFLKRLFFIPIGPGRTMNSVFLIQIRILPKNKKVTDRRANLDAVVDDALDLQLILMVGVMLRQVTELLQKK
jgi:hypothetical protein